MRFAMLGVILFAMACQSGRRAAPMPPPPPADVAGLVMPVPTDDVLAYLPDDTGLVASIDVKRLLTSDQPESLSGIRNLARALLVQTCGSNPLEDVASAAVAFDLEGGEVRGVAVLTGVARDSALECARHLGPTVTAQVAPDSFVIQSAGSATMALFVDATTVIVSNRSTDTIATLRALVDRGAPLRGSPVFMAAWDELPHHDPIELLLNGQSALAARVFASQVAHPKVIVGAVALGDRVVLHAVATMADPGDAVVFTEAAQAAVSAVQAVAKSQVTTRGTAVALDASLSRPQLEGLLQQLVSSY